MPSLPRLVLPWRLRVAAAVALAACGKSSKEPPKVWDAAPAPLALPALGVDSVKRMNYIYGDGAADYARAVTAYKTKDWAAIRASCEAAIKKDPAHLDAHRLLATAAAQLGDRPTATEHLGIALAGDWRKFGPKLATDQDLTDYFATPEGKQLVELAGRIGAETTKREAAGTLVIGRRSTFKWPARPGVQGASSRGELYAFVPDGPEGARFFRITHSDDTVVAWLRAPSGNELAVVGFTKVEMPDAKAPPTAAPLLAQTWIDTLDAHTFAPTGKRAWIGKGREVAVYYAAGDQLVATTAEADGRWKTKNPVAYSIDRTTGKATKTKAPSPAGPTTTLSLDDTVRDGAPAGIDATWDADGMAAELKVAGKTIAVPDGGRTRRADVAVSPKASKVAFVVWADPCVKDAVPSLYAYDLATGHLSHILTVASRFGARWLDDQRLIYEDDAGGLRVWDGATSREALHVSERGGLALDGLAAAPRPICKQAPFEAGEKDDGTDTAVPAEGDGAGSGSAGSGSAADGAAPAATP
jgi:hypothetical protein